MRDAIARAARRVSLEMYWFADDAIGRAFRADLADAAARGVEVQILVDGFGSFALPRGFWRDVETRGGEVEIFRPILSGVDRTFPRGLLARDHRKILVVDEHEAFVGGLNIARQWLSSSGRRALASWRDTAMRVTGREIGSHLSDLFTDTWERCRNREPVSRRPRAIWSASDGKVGVIANTPEDRRRRRIRQAYLWAIRHAKFQIDITCAYFAPRRLFVRALSRAVQRGARVRILLPLRSDVLIADVLARPWVRFLDQLGVEMYGYAASTLHAKTAVVDGRLVTVGSHNLDALSWAYNLECNVVVEDPQVGREASEHFEEDLSVSTRLRPPRSRLLDRITETLADAAERFYDA